MYRKKDKGFYFMIPISLKILHAKIYIVDKNTDILYFENNK